MPRHRKEDSFGTEMQTRPHQGPVQHLFEIGSKVFRRKNTPWENQISNQQVK
jgi:hypothetical protein